MKATKSIFLSAIFTLLSFSVFAQSKSGFGIKAGVNYNQTGDLIGTSDLAVEDIRQGADGRFGYHVGIFGKIKLAKLYVRPELIYTKATSSYDIDGNNNYSTSKIDLPILLGINIIGPVHIFAGPALQARVDSTFENFSITDVEKDFTVGAHLGVGVNLGDLGLDVRYERGFNENEVRVLSTNVAGTSGRLDSRPSQVIFSLSYKL